MAIRIEFILSDINITYDNAQHLSAKEARYEKDNKAPKNKTSITNKMIS